MSDKKENSTTIKSELDKTNQRITEIQSQLAIQTAAFESAQSGFIAGKLKLEDSLNEQQKTKLLEQALDSLKTRQRELETAYQSTFAAETKKARLESAKSTALEAEKILDEYLEMRNELNDIIAVHAEKLFNKFVEFREKQQAYLKTCQQIEPGIIGFHQPTHENLNLCKQVNAEVRAVGLTEKTLNLATTDTVNLPPINFGGSILAAEAVFANKRASEDRQRIEAETRAKVGVERAAREAEVEAQKRNRAQYERELAEQKVAV